MRAPRLPALLVVACASLLAACSGTTSSVSPTATAAASAVASTPAGSPAASSEVSAAPSAPVAAAGTLPITAKEFSFELPATVEAGVTAISLNNTGAESHQAQLVKIADGSTLSDVVVALNGDPTGAAALALATLSGGPTGVAPGTTGSASVKLDPGQYAFICFFRGADGIPHFAKGMIAPLNVTGTAASGTLPAGDAKLTVKDFSFDLKELSSGKHTVSVTNNGPQSHEAGIVKLNDGVTVESAIKALSAPPAPSAAPSPPPWTDAGGMAAIAPNTTATFDVDLPAGNYAFVCFVPDAKTGKPHVQLGMIGALTIQ